MRRVGGLLDRCRLGGERLRNASRGCLLIQHLQPRFTGCCLESVVLIYEFLCFACSEVIAVGSGFLHRSLYCFLLAPYFVLRRVQLCV